MKKQIVMFFAAAMAAVAFAAPEVTDVVAKQRYPWNGLVDITCNVTGINGTTNKLEFAVVAVMPDSGNARSASQFWVIRNGMISLDQKVRANGIYHLLWDAHTDLGQVHYNDMIVRVILVIVHDKVQLWAGGPYWATNNIGAEQPWESGYYFWWGDTIGYKRVKNAWVASDGSLSNFLFSESNTPTCNKSIATLQLEGWITADSVLVPEHDAAKAQWYGAWRMPTSQEFIDLKNKCDWTWTTMNGVNGYIVRGKGDYSSANIFLPATGYARETSLKDTDSGLYWSSDPWLWLNNITYSLALDFGSGSYEVIGTGYRVLGGPIRPVQGFTE